MTKVQWAGNYTPSALYQVGCVVMENGYAYMAKEAVMGLAPKDHLDVWLYLGEDTMVRNPHPWHPERIQVPVEKALQQSKLTDVVYVCSDCWKDNSFRRSFRQSEHNIVIEEFP